MQTPHQNKKNIIFRCGIKICAKKRPVFKPAANYIDITERNCAKLTQSYITGYGKHQNPLLIESKRKPNAIIKTSKFCHLKTLKFPLIIKRIITNEWLKSKKRCMFFFNSFTVKELLIKYSVAGVLFQY